MSEPAASNSANKTDTPAKEQNPFQKLLQAGDRKLGQWGLGLNRHPILQFIFLGVIPFAEFVFGLFGGPSWLLSLIYNIPIDPIHAGHVAAADMLFNAAFAGLAPLLTALIVASLIIYGQIAQMEGMEKQIKTSDDQADRIRKQIIEGLERDVLPRLESAQASYTKDLQSQVDALAPGWTVATTDPVIRQYLGTISTAVRDVLQQTDDEHRVIIRSLFRGLAHRFAKVTTELPDKGVFMEPIERRKLTEELFNSTKSYHVIFCGFHGPLHGDWLWHLGYQSFLETAQKTHGESVSWTFIGTGQDQSEREQAIADVLSFNVRCYTFEIAGSTGDLGRHAFEHFFERGPLIEVFGRGFPALEGEGLKSGSYLTWKATSLKIRTSHRTYEAWTPQSQIRPPAGEGVWGADNIDKLVRAGVINSDQSVEFQVLDTICKHRKRISP